MEMFFLWLLQLSVNRLAHSFVLNSPLNLKLFHIRNLLQFELSE